MKYIKKVSAFVGICVVVTAFFVGVKLQSMKPTSEGLKFTLKSRQPRYKSEEVWIKTSDNMILEIPKWYIDQMKVLQILLAHQKDKNSKDNPIDASMITSEQLMLLQVALKNATDLKKHAIFFSNLTQDEKTNLINSAFTLEAQGLASLLIAYMFPMDVQEQMGATLVQPEGVIAQVISHLTDHLTYPINHKGPIRTVQLSPDDNNIISAAAGLENNLILYTEETEIFLSDPGKPFLVNTALFSPDGKYIITGLLRTFDNLLLWDGVTGKLIKKFVGFENRLVNCIACSPDSKYVIAGSRVENNTLKDNNPAIYDINTGKMIHGFNDNDNPIETVSFSPDGNKIMIVDDTIYENLALYNSTTYQKKSFTVDNLIANCLSFTSDGNHILAAAKSFTTSNNLWLINTETGQKTLFCSFDERRGIIQCFAFSHNGKYIAIGLSDGLILLDGKTGEIIPSTLNYTQGNIGCVTFSFDDNFLVYGKDNDLMICRIITQKVLDDISTKLNIAQARFLYRLYLAQINGVSVILDPKDLDYQIFMTLPEDVQEVVKAFLPFELPSDIVKKEIQQKRDIFEKEVQQKMNELRTSLLYVPGWLYGKTEKTHDEKVKAVKNAMLKFDQHSAAYKACERLLVELEQKEAFRGIEEKK